MSGKQHKRELKRQKELERERQRQAERRRSMVTVGIASVILLLGAGLVWTSVSAERRAEAAAACGATRPEGAERDKSGLQLKEAPAPALRSGDYTAVIETSCGTLTVDLYEDRAPITVNNFVALAAGLEFYDGLQIFRNAPSIFALQTGAGSNDGSFQIGYTFADELDAAKAEGYKAGSLAMANSGPDTNGSQFFFTYGDSSLPPQYSKFGQVTEGLDVLERIGAIPANGETPSEKIYIDNVRILVDGKDLTDILEQEREREKAESGQRAKADAKADEQKGE